MKKRRGTVIESTKREDLNGIRLENFERSNVSRRRTLIEEKVTQIPRLFSEPSEMTKEEKYSKLYADLGFFIFKHNFNENTYKFECRLPKSMDQVIELLSSPYNFDSTIKSHKILNKLGPCSYLLKEIREIKDINKKAIIREFVFIRTLFSQKEIGKKFKILSKSTLPLNYKATYTLGDINYSKITLNDDKNGILLKGKYILYLKGNLNPLEEKDFIIEMIKQFSNIRNHLGESDNEQSDEENEIQTEEYRGLNSPRDSINITRPRVSSFLEEKLLKSDRKFDFKVIPKSETQPKSFKFSIALPKINDIDFTKTKTFDKILITDVFTIRKGIFVATNQEALNEQKKHIKNAIKIIGKKLISGENITNISLPVVFFQPNSFLEAIVEKYRLLNYYLCKADNAKDPIECLNHLIGFNLSMRIATIPFLKPFNPILGETYQAFIDNSPIYLEQTSHHPPISTIYMPHKDFTFSSSIEIIAKSSGNHVRLIYKGIMKVLLKKKNYRIQFPSNTSETSGIIIGTRRLYYNEIIPIYLENENILVELSIYKNKNGIDDYVESRFLKLKPGAHHQINFSESYLMKRVPDDQIDQVLGYGQGGWHSPYYFNDFCYFDPDEKIVTKISPTKYPLPSDPIFRRDIIELKKNDIHESQKAKEELEIIQRKDRELRNKFHGLTH